MTSEADTRANFIDPALLAAGWGSQQIIREYYFTDGRKLAGDQRGSRCFVDYLLHSDNRHLAIIEAKKQSAHPTKGLQQAIDYAEKLSVRFVYSTNGDRFMSSTLNLARVILSMPIQHRVNCWLVIAIKVTSSAGNSGISRFTSKLVCSRVIIRNRPCMQPPMRLAPAASAFC